MTSRTLWCVASIAFLAGCMRDAPPPAPVAASAPAAAATAPADAVDRTRPALRVSTLDGGTFDLADQRGQWVVVNFWATWCSPCLKEMPELSALDTQRDDVRVIGLAYEEIEVADMQAFLEAHPVDYPIALVDTYAPPAGFDVPRGLPTTHVVAPDGRIARSISGPVTRAEIEAVIAGHKKPAS